jgi:hypothetical protein
MASLTPSLTPTAASPSRRSFQPGANNYFHGVLVYRRAPRDWYTNCESDPRKAAEGAMRTGIALLALVVIGGVLPTGLFGLADLPKALALSGGALLLLLVACVLMGCMLTRVGHEGQEGEHPPVADLRPLASTPVRRPVSAPSHPGPSSNSRLGAHLSLSAGTGRGAVWGIGTPAGEQAAGRARPQARPGLANPSAPQLPSGRGGGRLTRPGWRRRHSSLPRGP